jgi:AcrR family transcriptional regulator
MSARRTRRTPSKLDRDNVVGAALVIAENEGLEAISLRRLADQFGVTPMALYWHFEDKEALLGALADRLWADTADSLRGSLEDLANSEDEWAQLRATLTTLVEVMRRHPAVADLMPGRVMETDAGLEVTEATLGYLARRGFSSEQAVEIARFVLSSAVMMVTSQPGIKIPEPDERAETQRRKQVALASLDLGRYPHIVASAHALTDFEKSDVAVACDVIVAGVSAQAPYTRRSQSRTRPSADRQPTDTRAADRLSPATSAAHQAPTAASETDARSQPHAPKHHTRSTPGKRSPRPRES